MDNDYNLTDVDFQLWDHVFPEISGYLKNIVQTDEQRKIFTNIINLTSQVFSGKTNYNKYVDLIQSLHRPSFPILDYWSSILSESKEKSQLPYLIKLNVFYDCLPAYPNLKVTDDIVKAIVPKFVHDIDLYKSRLSITTKLYSLLEKSPENVKSLVLLIQSGWIKSQSSKEHNQFPSSLQQQIKSYFLNISEDIMPYEIHSCFYSDLLSANSYESKQTYHYYFKYNINRAIEQYALEDSYHANFKNSIEQAIICLADPITCYLLPNTKFNVTTGKQTPTQLSYHFTFDKIDSLNLISQLMDVFIPMIENEVVKEILAKDINFHDCLKKAVLINTLNNKLPIKDFKPIKNKI